MNKKEKELFEKYLKLSQEQDYIVDIAHLATQCGYVIEDMHIKEEDVFSKETIATVSNTKNKKIILKNNQYTGGVCRFCVAYFLAKDYLGKLKETEIYTCIEIPDKEAYLLARDLIAPYSFRKNIEPEQVKVKCNKLIIPFRILFDIEPEK